MHLDSAIVIMHSLPPFSMRLKGKMVSMSANEHMAGRVCLVTGATSGIGKATALGLAQMGAHVFMLGRNPDKLNATKLELDGSNPAGRLSTLQCDLSSMADIRRFAGEFMSTQPKLHALIHNAGVSPVQKHETAEGFELTFAVNHLAPFLLTHLLHDGMAHTDHSRIVCVSSSSHTRASLDFDNLQAEKGFKRGMKTYGHTKLMNLLFAFALARRLQGTKTTVNAGHPGVVRTDLVRDVTGFPRLIIQCLRPFFLSPEEGAKTPIFLATDDSLEGVSGKYFSRFNEATPSADALNRDHQERLWELSMQMAGLSDPS